jgi:hypothetical protein
MDMFILLMAVPTASTTASSLKPFLERITESGALRRAVTSFTTARTRASRVHRNGL